MNETLPYCDWHESLGMTPEEFEGDKARYLTEMAASSCAERIQAVHTIYLEALGINLSKLDFHFIAIRRDWLAGWASSVTDVGEFYAANLSSDIPIAQMTNGTNYSLVVYRVNGIDYPLCVTYKTAEQIEYFSVMNALESDIPIPLMSYRDIYSVSLRAIESPLKPFRLSGIDRNDISNLPLFPGIFSPNPHLNPFAYHLIDIALPVVTSTSRVLIIGAGSGIEAVTIAKKTGAYVDTVDINALAVANTQASAVYTGTETLVKSWKSNLFSDVTTRYDVIVFNMPVVVDRDVDNTNTNIHDPDGALLERLLAEYKTYLNQGGSLYFMNLNQLPPAFMTDIHNHIIDEFEVDGTRYAVYLIKPAPEIDWRLTNLFESNILATFEPAALKWLLNMLLLLGAEDARKFFQRIKEQGGILDYIYDAIGSQDPALLRKCVEHGQNINKPDEHNSLKLTPLNVCRAELSING